MSGGFIGPYGNVAYALGDSFQILPLIVITAGILLIVLHGIIERRQSAHLSSSLLAILVLILAIASSIVLWDKGHTAFDNMVTGDDFAQFFNVLFAFLGIVTIIVTYPYLRVRQLPATEFNALLLSAIAGMMVMASSLALPSLFVGLELLSISLYILCGYTRTEEQAQESAAKYLLMGGYASAFVLYGMALIYGATGSVFFSNIAKALSVGQSVLSNPLLLAGIAAVVVGFAFKASAAPFHMWTPDVYEGAPVPVTAFMSVGTKAAAVAMIIRVFIQAVPQESNVWSYMLAFTAAVTIIVGNMLAIRQNNIKRLLAYSGIAQIGYILIGVISASRPGTAAALFYLAVYLFMNFGAFVLTISITDGSGEKSQISDLRGIGYRNPLAGIALTVLMLSLAGFPPTAGFIGKVFLFTSGVAAGFTWLVFIAAIFSVVSVYYYLRVVIYTWTPIEQAEAHQQVNTSGTILSTITGIAVIFFGIAPAYVLNIANTALHGVVNHVLH